MSFPFDNATSSLYDVFFPVYTSAPLESYARTISTSSSTASDRDYQQQKATPQPVFNASIIVDEGIPKLFDWETRLQHYLEELMAYTFKAKTKELQAALPTNW